MVRAIKPAMSARLPDKHLLVSVGTVNWAGRGRDQDLQPATHACQNRRQLARWFDHLGLNELGSSGDAIVSRVDRAADQFNFFACHFRSFIREVQIGRAS